MKHMLYYMPCNLTASFLDLLFSKTWGSWSSLAGVQWIWSMLSHSGASSLSFHFYHTFFFPCSQYVRSFAGDELLCLLQDPGTSLKDLSCHWSAFPASSANLLLPIRAQTLQRTCLNQAIFSPFPCHVSWCWHDSWWRACSTMPSIAKYIWRHL